MKIIMDIARVFRNEISLMISDMGLLVFFILLPLAYPVVYTLIYNPEVVRNVPVAIVDDSRSARSRELVRMADATPAISVYGYATDMAQAKEWWANREVYGIIHIPSDYDTDISTAQQAHASVYCDMSLLLRYRTLLTAITSLQLEIAHDITDERVALVGAQSMGMAGLPIESESHFLGDPQQGFASFVMPGIVVLILQQSMILGIGLLGATSRERRRRNGGFDPLGINGASSFSSVVGKSMAYLTFYIVPTLFILHYIPEMFNLPHIGSPVDYLLFIFPMLLASSFLGQALVIFLREREYVFIYLVFTSVVFLFLSGLTWPLYAMNDFWRGLGALIPATHGVEGFIRINSNGATVAENSHEFIALWVLAGLYMLLAIGVTKYLHSEGRAKTKASAQRSPSIAADTIPPA